jgi:hypothetical protein
MVEIDHSSLLQLGECICFLRVGQGKLKIISLLARRARKSRAQKISEVESRAVKMARRVGGALAALPLKYSSNFFVKRPPRNILAKFDEIKLSLEITQERLNPKDLLRSMFR